jgi:formylglycine-generating enzyme required for sulfatase activity
MADDPRIQRLLDELLDHQATPEEVCVTCPELLPVVRNRWQQIRPTSGSGTRTDMAKYDNADNKDPHGAKEGGLRVWRGGAWSCDPGHCRATVRYYVEPARRDGYTGFRVAVSASRTP